MQAVAAHPIPAGPLAVRWLAYELGPPRAGTLGGARLAFENAGAAAWHGLAASYHWLDDLGNAIVWDGLRTPAPALVPGERADLELPVRAPIPPGGYRLAFDLVLELRCWLSEIGNAPLQLELEVLPRDARGAVAHLPAGVEPAPDWHERARAAHEEGYAAVGGSLDAGWRRQQPLRARRRAQVGAAPAGFARRRWQPTLPGGAAGWRRELRPWRPGSGRNPAFGHPLVCPSLLPPLEPNCEVAGLPAWQPEGDEPWTYDGRITARLRSDRRRG